MAMLDQVVGRLSSPAALKRAQRLTEKGQHARAFALYTTAARSGIAEAEYRVGRCYLEGSGVPISHTEGLRWLRSAATRGHIEAQWFLAAVCIQGVDASGTPEDTSRGAVSL